MSSIQVTEAQEDFSAGMNRDAAPHLIDKHGAYDLLDIVLDDDGSAYRRGGTVAHSANTLDERGTFIFDGVLRAGRRTIVMNKSSTYVLDEDDETLVKIDTYGMTRPGRAAVMNGLVFGPGGWVTAGVRSSVTHTTAANVSVTSESATVTRSSGSWSGQIEAGHLMRIGTDRVYEVKTVASGTSLTLMEPYQGASDSTATAVFRPVVWGDGDYGGEAHVAVCSNRLVYAAKTRVRFSVIGNPHKFETFDYHELPTGAEISGLAELGGTLIVFTTDGIWTVDNLAYNIVDANGNGQHTIRRLSEDIILAGTAGVAGYSQTLIVPASDGIWLLDGVSSPERISQGVERPYKAWLKWGARIGQAVVYAGHYLLPLVSPAGTVKELLVCRISRPVKSRWRGKSWPWSRFQGDAAAPAFAARHGADQLSPHLLAVQDQVAAKVVDCSQLFIPDADHKKDADGSAPVAQIITRDYGSGNLTVNAVRALGLRFEIRGGTSPTVKVSWSKGGPNFDVAGYAGDLRPWGDPDAEWGESDGVWGDGFGPKIPDSTAAPVGPEWIDLPTPNTPFCPNGIERIRYRVNKRARYSRFRIICGDEVEAFRMRSLETFTRPSEAVRR